MRRGEFHLLASLLPVPLKLLDPDNVGQPAAVKSAPTQLPPDVRKFGYLPDFDLWRPGDLLLFSAIRPGFMRRQIIAMQEREGYAEEHARWHHAAVYIGDRCLCEAVPGGVRYRPVAEFVGDRLIRARRGQYDAEEDPREQGLRVAIRAMMRLMRPYSLGRVMSAWVHSWNRTLHPIQYNARGRAIICSQLFHDAYQEATGRSLVESVDTIVLPAQLSACEGLDDVESAWAPLP